MKEEFPVICITRDDLEWKGFKAKDLNDDTMEVISSKMSDYMLDELDYWSALVASCEWHGIPRKEEDNLEDPRLTDKQRKELGYE